MYLNAANNYLDWEEQPFKFTSKCYGVVNNQAEIDQIQPGTVFRHVTMKFDANSSPYYLTQYANGYILSAQSEYFQQILQTNPGDGKDIVLSYPGLEKFAVERLIKCMITGTLTLEKNLDRIEEALRAARKFELKEMQIMCARAYSIVYNAMQFTFGCEDAELFPFDTPSICRLLQIDFQ